MVKFCVFVLLCAQVFSNPTPKVFYGQPNMFNEKIENTSVLQAFCDGGAIVTSKDVNKCRDVFHEIWSWNSRVQNCTKLPIAGCKFEGNAFLSYEDCKRTAEPMCKEQELEFYIKNLAQ
ncbi:unnamed protein product [Brassicogethes aeneus]|uniref:BPTI/Kunitz inhibitor domain-containing protein n=1 Tax=Brassicogethes aeneus TaxID=1431903 RepID=A0A9P0B3Q7_BRAAE|nr:unnamed protein product [Brassicogethes aeneus]